MWWINTHRWDLVDVGALVAPRPLLIASADRDGIFTTLQPAGSGGDTRTKQLWKLGQRTLRWRGSDPNGDELRFRIEVRAEAAAAWLPVTDDVDDDHFGFDATVLPDGRYRFRLTASDSRATRRTKRSLRSRRASRWSSTTRRRSVAAPSVRAESGASKCPIA